MTQMLNCRLAPSLFALLVVMVPPLRLCAQDGAAHAVETITEADVRRRINIIADDSMGGRDTPSKGLDMTAAYIASEFKRFGLKPGGDHGSFEQRYSVTHARIDGEKTFAVLSVGKTTITASATRDLAFFFGPRHGSPVGGPVLLVGGPLSAAAGKALAAAGRIVLIAADVRSANSTSLNQFLQGVITTHAAAVLIASNADSAVFARQVSGQFRSRTTVGDADTGVPVVAAIHQRVLDAVLSEAGVDLARARSTPSFTSRELPALSISVTITDAGGLGSTAPNVVGILEGSDPVLRDEYVVFSAHMDHIGINPNNTADSISNGADDDASGTTGVIELAEAFSRPGARPKRSLVFLTVSGEEKGLWGSEYFAAHAPIPVRQIVADLNIDMIGRNWRDTIVAIGKEHSNLGATLNRVTAAHPELGMRAIDDIWPEENFYFRSDHYNFAKRGIPILFFFNGTHADYHQASDSPDKIDAEKEARIVRLIYYVGEEVANNPERPKWKDESYRKIVEPQYRSR